MEKRSPHCTLAVVKALVSECRVQTTRTAFQNAATLGFDVPGMIDVVLALTPGDFYKSMTTHADHRVWQDVYRPMTVAGQLYVKLTVVDGVLIVSFKEL